MEGSRDFQNCSLYISWVSAVERCSLGGVPLYSVDNLSSAKFI